MDLFDGVAPVMNEGDRKNRGIVGRLKLGQNAGCAHAK